MLTNFVASLQGGQQEHSWHLHLHQRIVTGLSTSNRHWRQARYCCIEALQHTVHVAMAQHRAAPCLTMLGLCYSQLELP